MAADIDDIEVDVQFGQRDSGAGIQGMGDAGDVFRGGTIDRHAESLYQFLYASHVVRVVMGQQYGAQPVAIGLDVLEDRLLSLASFVAAGD